jgi:doublecortin-like kinase 1/2
MGVISYILLCGFPPFRADSGEKDELFEDILSGRVEFPAPHWDDVDIEAQDLIIQILNRDEQSRLSAHDVLKHEWLNSPNNDFNQELNPKCRSRFGWNQSRINPAQSMPSLYETRKDNEVSL